MAYDISAELIGNSILRASGDLWQKQRAVMEKGMNHSIMEKALPRVIQTANELCDKWEKIARQSRNTAEVDVAEEALKFTLDVIGRAAFSHDFGSVTAKSTADAPLYLPFQVILRTLDRRCNLVHEHFLRWLPTERNRAFNAAMKVLSSQVENIVSRTEPKGDLLDILMENKDTPKGISSRLVKDNVQVSVFAGHDTTGAALTWMLRLLAEHPDAMRKIREEVLRHFGPNGDPSYQDLENLDYLNAVVLETLRLYPSAAFTRTCDHDVILQGGKYVIPTGTQMLVVPFIAHRDERYWERPSEFLPERFLNEELDRLSQDARGNSLQSRIGRICAKKPYLPFSLGPRNCVGRPLALMEMRVALVKLLQRFSFELPKDQSDYSSFPLFNLTLNPANVRLTPILLSGN